jgi:hypothetical protein
MKDFLGTMALVLSGFLIGVGCSLFMVWKTQKASPPEPPHQAVADSIRPSAPPTAVRIDTVWLPAIPLNIKIPENSDLSEDSAAQPQNCPADTAFTPAIRNDSALVAIPIVEQTFEGEFYKAVVQGYSPLLKSIEIWHPDPPKPKQKWWSVAVGPQLGYGFTPSGWQPYAGIGVTIGISF